jgi:hypothetical protein
MNAGVPLATIQRWLGHHNIAQTSKHLAASLGAGTRTRCGRSRPGSAECPVRPHCPMRPNQRIQTP